MNSNKSAKPLHLAFHAVNSSIKDAQGLNNDAYTDPNFFLHERDHVFGKHWSAIAYATDLPENGYAMPVDFMGLPLLLIRNNAGEINVAHNVCSHRGMKLVHKAGLVNHVLTCPYHAWVYDLNGQLKATPHFNGLNQHRVEGFDTAKHGLKPVRAEIWMGIIFVNLSGDACEFAEFIDPLVARWKSFSQNIEDLHIADDYSTLQLEVQCNWKLAVENYCEAYHLPIIHPALNSYSPLSEHYNVMLGDSMSGQGTYCYNLADIAGTSLPQFPDWPQEEIKTGEYLSVYPNLLIGVQCDHVFAIIINPIAPNLSTENLRLYFVGKEALQPEFADHRKAVLESWKDVFDEDIFAIEGMQLGRQSPAFQGGVFSPALDESTHHFHCWVSTQYEQTCGQQT